MKFYLIDDAEKIWRREDPEIFHGMGIHHRKDAYDFISVVDTFLNGAVPMYQAIAEGIIFFAESYQMIKSGDVRSDIRFDRERNTFFCEQKVTSAWWDSEVISRKVGYYRSAMYKDKIIICAYDTINRSLASSMNSINSYYKLLPIVSIVLASDITMNEEFAALFNNYADEPTVTSFAKLYLEFYLRHKDEHFEVSYANIPYGPYKDLTSLADYYKKNKDEEEKEVRRLIRSEKVSDVKRFDIYEFKEEYRNLIPKYGNEYVFPDNLINLSGAITEGDIRSVLFSGPAGTGKTMSCKLIAELIGLPLMDVVNCTDNLDEFILGKYVPEVNQIVFKESFVTKAIRDGGAVVFEEINFAKPQFLAFLNSLLDDNGFVRLDNGEVIKRNKNFRFFATMNVGYFGTKELNQALYNRFQAVVEVNDLSDEAIKTMLTERVPECAGFVDDAISLYHQIKEKIAREELSAVISPRNLENWMRLCKYEPLEDAAEKTIIPIAKGDRELELDLRLMLKQGHWRGV